MAVSRLRRRRQRFTRSDESDRDLVLQRIPSQFPLLAPLAQLLSGLLFVGAQFGEEARVHLVDRLIGVLALVVFQQEDRGAPGTSTNSGLVARSSITRRIRSHPVLQRLDARVAAGDFERDRTRRKPKGSPVLGPLRNGAISAGFGRRHRRQ